MNEHLFPHCKNVCHSCPSQPQIGSDAAIFTDSIMSELATVVTAAQAGQQHAFNQIVARFQDMAFATAYAMLGDAMAAQDAAQEAFLDAYTTLPNLREPAAFPGWFRRIIIKHSDRQIRGKRATLVPLESLDIRDHAPGPEELLQLAVAQEDVQAAIDLLPPNQRIVTLLFYIEGYSQADIAAFLEIPVSAVKKRLYNARQTLKERMLHMVQQTIQANRPSQDPTFAQLVTFFVGVLDGDVDQTQALLQQNPALFTETAEWKLAIPRHYAIGAAAIHLAVSRGNLAMTQMLLNHDAQATELTTQGKMTPLHLAAIMKRHPVAQLLLEHGADLNVQSAVGQTPLHLAALRDDREMAQLLLEQGAQLDIVDKEGHTPADLASLQNHDEFVAQLRTAGAPLPVTTAPTLPQPDRNGELLLTGIKMLDFLTPIRRGGMAGLFTPAAGVGFIVTLSQIMRSVQTLYNGHVIIGGLESHDKYEEYWRLLLRESDADRRVTYLLKAGDSDTQQRLQIAAELVAAAGAQRAAGHEVLLVIDSRLAGTEGVLTRLQEALTMEDGAATTLLIFGHHTVGVEPAPLNELETVITFGGLRASKRWYPAVSEIRSRSRLFETLLRGTPHAAAVQQAYPLLLRYADLHVNYEQGGLDTLWYIDDDPTLVQTITRARRLHRFLTQPFYGVEPWTGTLGRYVALSSTIAGCQAILNGACDELTEEELANLGTLEEV